MLFCAAAHYTWRRVMAQDQTPSPAQHEELGTGTGMFMDPAEWREEEQLCHTPAMRDRSPGNAQPHLPVPSTPPQPDLIMYFL